MAALSDAQMASFEADGYVLLRAPLSAAELDAAEAAFDRLIKVRYPELDPGAPPQELQAALAADVAFVKLISHPWFEAVAQQVLRAEQVRLIELGPTQHRPGTGEPQGAEAARRAWACGCHIDMQVSASDFDATPRRDILALWLWVNDVPAERAAMRILPGSHRAIQQHWERTLRHVGAACAATARARIVP
jgi:hypothetical protein